ncbi:MAG: hypothetical protein WC589_24570 [Sphingobacterium sp.]
MKFIALAIAFLFIFGCIQTEADIMKLNKSGEDNQGELKTIQGKVFDSKKKMIVDGILIWGVNDSEARKYLGKTIEITGYVRDRCEDGYIQSYSGPCMTKITKITIIEG